MIIHGDGFTSNEGVTKRIVRWLLVLTLSLFAFSPAWAADDEEVPEDGEELTEEPAKPKEPPKPHVNVDPDETRDYFLERQANPREIIKLQALDEEALSLFLPENAAVAQGAILLLHEEDAHPDWSTVINPLRTLMPDYGWATLSLALPSPGPAKQPDRTIPAIEIFAQMPKKEGEEGEEGAAEEGATEGEEGAEGEEPVEEEAGDDEEGDELGGEDEAPPAPAPEPEKPKAPIDLRVNARIDAALAQLETMNYERIVLLGHGTGAAWILGYLKESPLPPEQALVLVQPRLPYYDISVDIPSLLGEQQRPILDLYFTDTNQAKTMAKDRANYARRSGNPDYRQSRISGSSVNSQTDARGRRIAQTIRGWLGSRISRDPEREAEDPYLKGGEDSLYTYPGARSVETFEENTENGQRSGRTMM